MDYSIPSHPGDLWSMELVGSLGVLTGLCTEGQAFAWLRLCDFPV